MTTAEALAILRQHNAWRRGDEGIEQGDPVLIGDAIDFAVKLMEAAACPHVSD
jgi:hypothetical protein